jgi:integrase
LRHIKAVLRVAHDWNYLPQVPKVRMLREPEKLPQYVTAEHFADIYKACKVARFPKNMPYKTEDWWKALLVFCYMTGWRISEVLALRREDLDMDAATALTRHGDNKGKSDARVALHSVVIEHLTKIKSFEPVIFPWYHGEPVLWRQFTKIQEEAGIHLDCSEEHEHTPACHVYGFHDLRRAFASQNAPSLSAEALRVLMRHKSYQTTQRYINIAAKINEAVEKLHVPACLAKAE